MNNIYTILLALFSFQALAQSSVGIYNFDHIPQTALLNPAYDYGKNKHFTIPLMGHQLFVGNSGLTAYDILADNAVPFVDKLKSTANNMSANDMFIGQQRMDIFYAGMKKSGKQYTFGFYQETDFFSNFPKDVTQLFLEGNTQLGKTYTLEGLNTQANVTGVYHFGIQQAFDSKTSIGFRAKLYSGAVDARTKGATANIKTVQGTDNLYRYEITGINFNAQTTGLNVDNQNEITTGFLLKELFFSGNYGLGVDVGFVKQINQNLYLASSVNDVGFIYYRSDNTNFTANGNYTTEGIDLNYNGTTAEAYWNNFEDDFLTQTNYQEKKDKYLALRPAQWSTFLRYTLKRNRLAECTPKPFEDDGLPKSAFGVYTNVYLYNGKILPSGSLFFENRFGKAVNARLHYTADSFSMTNIGMATSINIWKINFYANVDNIFGLLDVAKTKSSGIQLGINYLN